MQWILIMHYASATNLIGPKPTEFLILALALCGPLKVTHFYANMQSRRGVGQRLVDGRWDQGRVGVMMGRWN